MAPRSLPKEHAAHPDGLGWAARLASEFAKLGTWARGGVALGGLLGAAVTPLALWLVNVHSPFGAPIDAAWPAVAVAMIGFAAFGACSVWLSIADLRTRRLPNSVVVLTVVGVVVPLSVASLVWGSREHLLWALSAATITFLLLALLWYMRPFVWGAGDVKLSFPVMFFVWWTSSFEAVFLLILATLLALIIGGIIAFVRRKPDFAYGPLMLGAGWLAAIAGPWAWSLISPELLRISAL